MNLDRIKVLGFSDSPQFATGFGTQAHELFKRLALDTRFDPIFCGWQNRIEPAPLQGLYYNHDSGQYSSTLIPNSYRLLSDLGPRRPDGRHDFGTASAAHYLKQEKPDILWVLGDSFFFAPPESDFCKLDYSPAKFVLWYPSDGVPLPANCAPIFARADVLVAMSKFGQKQAIEGVAPLNKSYDARYIPHTIDTNVFVEFNEQQRLELRKKWSIALAPRNGGRYIDLTSKFVCGVVARNQPRKMLPDMLKIFKEFSKDKPDAVLLLHSAINDQGGNLEFYCNLYGIREKCVFTGMDIVGQQFSKKDLNELFNIFDVHVSATSGEGFGITTIEAQAAGIPSVITNFTTTHELVVEPECGLGVDVGETIVGSYAVDRAMASKTDFVNKMNLIYYDRNLLKKYAKNCRPNAVKHYNHNIGFEAWRKLLMEMVE